jgi:class 3 adenylate cyclase
MAVTGLPNPDESHAVHMSRFAYQCLVGMRELIRELEGILGPGTSDLALRVGLHSGPVTAGVLRGEKSRFQLFGDTVNTARCVLESLPHLKISCRSPVVATASKHHLFNLLSVPIVAVAWKAQVNEEESRFRKRLRIF